jgi:hypothetical protein
VGSIEAMPQVFKGMWPENLKNSFFLFLESPDNYCFMLEVQIILKPLYETKKRKFLQKKYDDDFAHTAIPYKTDHLNIIT